MPRSVLTRYPLTITTTLIVTFGCAGDHKSGTDYGSKEWTIGDTPQLAIGVDDSRAGHTLDRVVAARLLPDGGVAIADGGSHEIRVFAADGSLEHRWGRRGEGPGESQTLAELHFVPPDTLLVFDSELQRLTTFDLKGTPVKEVHLAAPDGQVEVYMGTLTDGSPVAAWIRRLSRDNSRFTADIMGVAIYSPDESRHTMLPDELGLRRARSPSPLSPRFLAAVLGDSIYHTDGLAGEVRITSAEGNRVGSFRLDWEPPPFREAWNTVAAIADSLGTDFVRRLEGVPGFDTVPVISRIHAAQEDNQLWIKRYAPSTDSPYSGGIGTGGEWAVVDRTGTVVSTVSVPEGIRLLDVDGDRVASVRRTALGVEVVEIRPLHRSP